jgi:predicted nucleic acid-binding protein
VKCIVSDTGPILHLTEAGCVDLLQHMGTVLIPAMVDLELRASISKWANSTPPWVSVERLDPSHVAEALAWQQAGVLHPGEAEAIALARQATAYWLLTDETVARLLAQSLGLEVHGSLGIVLWAAAKGYLSRAQAELTLRRLAGSSLWISPRVLEEANSSLDRLCS